MYTKSISALFSSQMEKLEEMNIKKKNQILTMEKKFLNREIVNNHNQYLVNPKRVEKRPDFVLAFD